MRKENTKEKLPKHEAKILEATEENISFIYSHLTRKEDTEKETIINSVVETFVEYLHNETENIQEMDLDNFSFENDETGDNISISERTEELLGNCLETFQTIYSAAHRNLLREVRQILEGEIEEKPKEISPKVKTSIKKQLELLKKDRRIECIEVVDNEIVMHTNSLFATYYTGNVKGEVATGEIGRMCITFKRTGSNSFSVRNKDFFGSNGNEHWFLGSYCPETERNILCLGSARTDIEKALKSVDFYGLVQVVLNLLENGKEDGSGYTRAHKFFLSKVKKSDQPLAIGDMVISKKLTTTSDTIPTFDAKGIIKHIDKEGIATVHFFSPNPITKPTIGFLETIPVYMMEKTKESILMNGSYVSYLIYLKQKSHVFSDEDTILFLTSPLRIEPITQRQKELHDALSQNTIDETEIERIRQRLGGIWELYQRNGISPQENTFIIDESDITTY